MLRKYSVHFELAIVTNKWRKYFDNNEQLKEIPLPELDRIIMKNFSEENILDVSEQLYEAYLGHLGRVR